MQSLRACSTFHHYLPFAFDCYIHFLVFTKKMPLLRDIYFTSLLRVAGGCFTGGQACSPNFSFGLQCSVMTSLTVSRSHGMGNCLLDSQPSSHTSNQSARMCLPLNKKVVPTINFSWAALYPKLFD